MTTHQTPTRQSGFTLVEVLVALVIMAVLAAMAWQGIDAMVRSRAVTQENIERTLRLSSVLSQWEHDLLSLQGPAPGPSPPPAGGAGGAGPSPAPRPGGFANPFYDGNALRLYRRTENGLQVVVWAVRDGALTRWASPPTIDATQLTQDWLRSQQLLGNEPNHLRALEGLSGMQVFCYRETDNAWSNCQSTAAGTRLVGMRVVLQFASGSGESTITRDIKLGPPT